MALGINACMEEEAFVLISTHSSCILLYIDDILTSGANYLIMLYIVHISTTVAYYLILLYVFLRLLLSQLKDTINLLGLEKGGSKSDLCDRLAMFLVHPTAEAVRNIPQKKV